MSFLYGIGIGLLHCLNWKIAFSWWEHQPLFGDKTVLFPWPIPHVDAQKTEQIAIDTCYEKIAAKERGEHIVP